MESPYCFFLKGTPCIQASRCALFSPPAGVFGLASTLWKSGKQGGLDFRPGQADWPCTKSNYDSNVVGIMHSDKSPLIAIVDDDPRVLESLDNLLKSVGYRVRCFSSGHAVLENAGLDDIECLISDVGLPGMNGFELQRIALAERPDLPVILITGRYEASHPQGAQPNNRGIFQKPFNVDELLRTVAGAVRGTR